MTPNETRFFELLDAYARARHGCFLAEFFLWTEERGYSACFCPLEVSESSSSLYPCKYLKVPTEHVRAAGREQLPPSLVTQLDAELAKLKAGNDPVRGPEHQRRE